METKETQVFHDDINLADDESSNRNFSLSTFSRASKQMVATNDCAYSDRTPFSVRRLARLKDYTPEEIQSIIESGSLSEQQKLSRNYFHKDGYYKQIIIHYATLLMYQALLIPNPSNGKKLSDPRIQKRYYSALEFVENMQPQTQFINCALKALIDGAYYGVRVGTDKKTLSLLDLPAGYAVSNFKDAQGNDIVEFDVSYFNTLTDKKQALAAYPKIVQKAYHQWNEGKRTSRWVMLPSDIGVCFPFFDGRPLFLSIIPATIEYDEAVATERERDQEEIRKIIVQKIPHLTDGRLLFEPDEALEMHQGAVGMTKKNKNMTVLTTYGDVDAIVSKTSADNSDSMLTRMEQNIFAQGGVSGQIFAATGSSSVESSLVNDLALMMYLANKLSNFMTNLLNAQFGNGNVSFKYLILPITWHNQQSYVDNSFKLSSSGYSFLMPAMAMGLSQRDLGSLKDLENELMKLDEKLIPLASSYTQSGSKDSEEKDAQDDKSEKTDKENPLNPQDQGGRPKLKESQKSEKTIKNETSKDKTGGS